MSNVSSKAEIKVYQIVEQPYGYSIMIKETPTFFRYYDFKKEVITTNIKGKITLKKIEDSAVKLIEDNLYFRKDNYVKLIEEV